MSHDDNMKMVEDFLSGTATCDNVVAQFLKTRHTKKMEELKAVRERLSQAQEMVRKLESETYILVGAVRECVDQLSEVLSGRESETETQE